MKLSQLVGEFQNDIISIANFCDCEVRGVSQNSKRIHPGEVFFCLSGSRFQGGDFIEEAQRNGARAIVVEQGTIFPAPKNLPILTVKDIRRVLGLFVNRLNDFPLEKLTLFSITGTNGKTTTTFLIESILQQWKRRVGVIGTVNYRFANKERQAPNTTPDIVTVYGLFDDMLNARVDSVVMEVSSHALAQRRIEGVKFDYAVFTNLTQDHLDYHRTFTQYFNAKSLLFRDYLKPKGIVVINIDDPYGKKMISLLRGKKSCRILTYGLHQQADIRATDIALSAQGTSFVVKGCGRSFRIQSNLIGMFNVYNLLASISACIVDNVPTKYIAEGVRSVFIPGRLNRIAAKNNISIFVDYAHTPDALKNILTALRPLRDGNRLIVVFGCGGDRDKGKRPKMGRIANTLADQVILTSDNPRSENPAQIISEIKKGIRASNVASVLNRKEAIGRAISEAHDGDLIVVAGKGHETYQIIKNRKLPFHDPTVIKNILTKKHLMLRSN